MHKFILTLAMFVFLKSETIDELNYFGGWPKNILKNNLPNPGFEFDCNDSAVSKDIGCQCIDDKDCKSEPDLSSTVV